MTFAYRFICCLFYRAKPFLMNVLSGLPLVPPPPPTRGYKVSDGHTFVLYMKLKGVSHRIHHERNSGGHCFKDFVLNPWREF
jgi:hypothetical protein